ncbi:DUF357 domain-containing protein [Methanoregula sp.]|jgi:hypothetical protein|uniref:DUF357 domain-containing protein n=1 Tax=Methanoregula sp. TaxID=2052170 RepID=UPI0026190940|nr:DUF357 domain-containing protein [Methanoregula sp.]MDD5143450.1 DUF357 domain-containing protein [Methanoregula sp.]
MRIAECATVLASALEQTTCSAPEGTLLGKTGDAVLRMASAYESDGRTFLSIDDPVNALAAFLYGLGWLHCGIASGALACSGGNSRCPFATPAERVPATHFLKLGEKTGRYARLLQTAIASVTPAPAPGTPAHAFAGQVLFIAGIYLENGSREASEGRREDALSCFSYGHGWLDAGVGSGLFAIHANHEIFTVD